MNFFKSLGLTGDPFSTSPNTQLFYNSTGHRQCLEGLELAIRMRRGLSVVQGGVGVGKPARPDYPYEPASQNYRHKIGIYSSILLAAVAMMYGLAVMFGE